MAFTCTAGAVSMGSFSLIRGVRKSIKGCVVPMSWLSTYSMEQIGKKISDNKQQNQASLTQEYPLLIESTRARTLLEGNLAQWE